VKRAIDYLPGLLIVAAGFGLWAHGPILQLPHYNDFADQRAFLGIHDGANVLSNVGFAAVGIWGLWRLWPVRQLAQLTRGWPGYCLFLISLVLTALGSGFYHLDPNDSRLVWDRLPIALACAGLLAAVYSESRPSVDGRSIAVVLSLAAVLSVVWWHVQADLGPYLLLQGAPLLLIPLWQALYRAPRGDRIAFGVAIALYALAKVAELHDNAVWNALGWLSGHTVKHLLATASAAAIVGCLVWRTRQAHLGSKDAARSRLQSSLNATIKR
jgi:hypothetical protein